MSELYFTDDIHGDLDRLKEDSVVMCREIQAIRREINKAGDAIDKIKDQIERLRLTK